MTAGHVCWDKGGCRQLPHPAWGGGHHGSSVGSLHHYPASEQSRINEAAQGFMAPQSGPTPQPEPTRELWPARGYLQPHKLGPGLQLPRSGGEVMGAAAFSSSFPSLPVRTVTRLVEKTTSHHSPDLPLILKHRFSQIFYHFYSHISPGASVISPT